MKSIDWTDDEHPVTPRAQENQLTFSARRVLVGSCPSCEAPLVVFNDNESWPLVGCGCGWHGDVPSVLGGMLFAQGERGRYLDAAG